MTVWSCSRKTQRHLLTGVQLVVARMRSLDRHVFQDKTPMRNKERVKQPERRKRRVEDSDLSIFWQGALNSGNPQKIKTSCSGGKKNANSFFDSVPGVNFPKSKRLAPIAKDYVSLSCSVRCSNWFFFLLSLFWIQSVQTHYIHTYIYLYFFFFQLLNANKTFIKTREYECLRLWHWFQLQSISIQCVTN